MFKKYVKMERMALMKRKIGIMMLVGMLSFTLLGCEKTEEKKPEKIPVDEVSEETVKIDEVYEQLFDLENPVSIQVQISDEELNKLQEDYDYYDGINSKSPIYRMADKVIISVGDAVYEIEEVGIRLKGNTSRVPVYDEDTGEMNLSHYRLSFNETFDDEDYYGEDAKEWDSEEEKQERKDRRFASLKGLEVKWNKNMDGTHIRELYAYDMFREYGVYAQRVNLCSFGMNGENFGLVNIYEPVDKEFIEKHFPKEDQGGDLYKVAWTYKPANYVESSVTYGVEDPDKGMFYNYDLKTNRLESKHENLENMLKVINDDNSTKEDFESVIDTEYLEKFMAVSYFVGNPDDYRNNYNNHYVYFSASTGKAYFIPYDYDRCLGITYGWNPDATGMTVVSPYSEDAEGLGREQVNPFIWKAVLNDDAYCKEGYDKVLSEIAGGDWLKDENFNAYYETAKENYEEVTEPTIDFANVDEEFPGFSLEGDYTSNDDSNMSFTEYCKRILESYNSEE